MTLSAVYLNQAQQQHLQDVLSLMMTMSSPESHPRRSLTTRRNHSLITFLLNTGLLLSEALNLSVDDVTKSDTILVPGRLARPVPMNKLAHDSITAWLAVRPDTGPRHLWVPLEHSEGNTLGLNYRGTQAMISRIGTSAGVQNLSPRILRTTFVKNLLDLNISPLVIGRLTGIKPPLILQLASETDVPTTALRKAVDALVNSPDGFASTGG